MNAPASEERVPPGGSEKSSPKLTTRYRSSPIQYLRGIKRYNQVFLWILIVYIRVLGGGYELYSVKFSHLIKTWETIQFPGSKLGV